MAVAMNTELVSHLDIPGGGQVWVDGDRCYVAHIDAPHGTSIYDVSDPAAPVLLGQIPMPHGWHSHKVRAVGDLMVVNHEKWGDGGPEGFQGGLAIYDVSDPSKPVLTGKWATGGKGVHRFDFDGEYVYLSATADGYRGNIAVILDVRDPAAPHEVSRWWIPGQWEEGGESYPWDDFVPPRCHHPLRVGDRLYVSYWHHGFYILDISDLQHPVAVGHSRRSPAFPIRPTPASCCRTPFAAGGTWSWPTRTSPRSIPLRRRSPWSTTSPTRRCPSPSRRYGPRHGCRRVSAGAVHRVPPALGAIPGHRHPVRLVRTRAPGLRCRRTTCSSARGLVSARPGCRRGSGFVERCDDGRSRADLPDRSGTGARHHPADRSRR